ncbi:MAG: N-acetylmuramic acid 6-phosphate etherase [Lentisphaeria bacterium]|nr:N-acetylmuramic acid 6-phosphate etherase [Lentisphaeria bacterium]
MNEKKPAGMSEAMQTEAIAEDNASLDTLSSLEIITRINENDQTVAQAVQRVLPQIAEAVELLVEALGNGGRLFYTGAGTSGRLGVVDASECPPTFGTPHEMVQGIIAGGRVALFHAREGCEDKDWMGARDLVRRGLRSGDVVCGLSTSGRTPYVLGALRKAREVGAKTIAVYCNPEGSVGQLADVAIVPVTGPEVVAGSTRMKAGTAEKMVLNMLSTATMVRLGRVSGNMMTNMKISCEKLRYRATRIIMQRLGVDEDEAWRLLAESKDDLAAIPGLQ